MNKILLKSKNKIKSNSLSLKIMSLKVKLSSSHNTSAPTLSISFSIYKCIAIYHLFKGKTIFSNNLKILCIIINELKTTK